MDKNSLNELILNEGIVKIIIIDKELKHIYNNHELATTIQKSDLPQYTLKYIKPFLEQVKQVINTQVRQEVSHEEKNDLGETKYFKIHIIPFQTEDNSDGIIIKEVDSTNQVNAEQDLGSIFKHSRQEIFIFSTTDMKFIEINNAALQNLGYSKEEMLLMTPLDLKEKFNKESFIKTIAPLKNGVIDKINFETPHTRKDGTIYPAEVHLCITNYKGQKVFQAIILDRSELNKNKERISHLEKLSNIGKIAAGVGHEVNNPLAIASGNLLKLKRTLQKENFENEQVSKAIDKQAEALERIRVIVDGLRTYARVETFDDSLFAVDIAIRTTIDLVKDIYESEGIKIELDLKSVNNTIHGNIGKFNQVIMNLISNAKDAISEKENGVIKITSYNDSGFIFIGVSDNGIGMSQELQGKIFDPFFTTKDVGKGTGMGMGILAEIVTSMSGVITLDSQENIGTSVLLKFQSRPTPVDSSQIKKEQKFVIKELKGTALILDDEPSLVEIYKDFLESFGLSVHTATSGQSALEKLSSTQYDYILTDMKMPKMTGEDFINKAIPLQSKETKFFILSGGDSSEFDQEKNALLMSKIQDYLMKPFSEEELYSSITGQKTNKAGDK